MCDQYNGSFFLPIKLELLKALQVKVTSLKPAQVQTMHSPVYMVTAEYDNIPTMPSRNRHKPWPSRKVTKVDEVIKYKSTFPNNIHPLGKGDDVQGKSLNVGVIDWCSLEKWTYFEKHVANRRGGDSPSSSSSLSVSFSTSISSSESDRSIYSSFSQRKQSATFFASQNPYSRTLHTKASIRHNHEHDKINKSDIKDISQDSSQPSGIGSSPCTPKNNDRSAFSRRNVKMESPQSCEQGFPGNVHLAEIHLPDQRSLIESTRNCLDESDCESSISVDSSMNRRSTKVNENSMTEIFPPNGINFTLPSPQISYSCPLFVSENEVPIAGGREDHLKVDGINHGLSEKFTSHAEVKVAARPKRDLSPQRLLRAAVNRIKISSSSSGQQIKQIIRSDNSCDDSATSNRKARRSSSPQRLLSAGLNLLRNSTVRKDLLETDNSPEDTAASNIRGRRSPLRRIFDPLKSKSQVHLSGLFTSLPSHRAQGASTSKLPVHDELKSATSTRQALVKLAWKDGLPLFVFSSCDSNILVATIGKGAASLNSKQECTYTIFTDHVELKKNDRVWTSPIKKNKKHDSADNTVVGQMKASSLKSTNEFVLYGGEQISTTNEHFSFLYRNEVAAIVIHDQSQIKLKNEKLTMVAILPSGVHGISSAGEPSPLIDRWKSGGSCDCGGWDEGCMLTVLSNKNQEMSSSRDEACTADEIHRIELFMQGETKENKHCFSMITIKEGVYTVDFRASISSLQAFAICIAILHSRKPITLSGFHHSVEDQSFEEETILDHSRVSSARYEYHPPPLSPIGRA